MSNYDTFKKILEEEAGKAGYAADSAMVKTLTQIAGAESNFDPRAKASTSNATGIFQFIDSTWRQNAEPGANKFDIRDQVRAAIKLTNSNIDSLVKNTGITKEDVTAGDIYLAHFAGAGGAAKILSADPSTPISRLLGRAAIDANAGIKFNGKSFAQFTAADIRDWSSTKMKTDIGARTVYSRRRANGETTAAEDEQEYDFRKEMLMKFGLSAEIVDLIPKDMLNSGLFLVMIMSLFGKLFDNANQMNGLAGEGLPALQPVTPTLPSSVTGGVDTNMISIPLPTRSNTRIAEFAGAQPAIG